MSLTEYESGSQTTSGTTEHFLGTDNDGTDGIFMHRVDLSDFVDGDEVVIRLYEKARTGDTVRLIRRWLYDRTPTDPLFESPWNMMLHNRRFSVQARAGTITIPWSVWQAPGTPTAYEEGSQTTSGTTEHFVGTDNDATDGFFQFVVDLNDMVKDDRLEISIYEKARVADTVRLLERWPQRHQQVEKLWISPILPFMHSRRFSLKATAGTITLPWSTRKV